MRHFFCSKNHTPIYMFKVKLVLLKRNTGYKRDRVGGRVLRLGPVSKFFFSHFLLLKIITSAILNELLYCPVHVDLTKTKQIIDNNLNTIITLFLNFSMNFFISLDLFYLYVQICTMYILTLVTLYNSNFNVLIIIMYSVQLLMYACTVYNYQYTCTVYNYQYTWTVYNY